MSDEWVSELKFNDEAIGLIANRLALECYKAALERGITGTSVELQLRLVLDVLKSNLDDLILVGPIIASGTSGLSLRIGFNPVAYRRMAEAAMLVMVVVKHLRRKLGQ